MLTKMNPEISYMKNTLISTLEEIIVILDTEYSYMNDQINDHREALNLVVNEKRNLAGKYATYCQQVHDLSDEDKEELSLFAKEHKDLLDTFSAKLNRNSEAIEYRCKRSQMRIDAALSAISDEENLTNGYSATGAQASNVYPIRPGLSANILS